MNARTLSILGSLLLGLGLFAQSIQPNPFRKGRFYASGGVSWKNEDYGMKNKATWNIEPQVGYFIIDNLAIGMGGVIGTKEFNYVQENLALDYTTYKYTNTQWGALGPVVRGHIGGPRLSAFGQIGAYFGSIDQTGENNLNAPTDTTSIRQNGGFQLYDFGAGLAWYYKHTVGLELIAHYYLGYAQTTQTITHSSGEVTEYPRAKNNADGGGVSIGLVFLFGLSKGQQAPAPVN